MAGLIRHLGFNFYYYINHMSRKFLLCFHDFSVWNYRKVTPILEELRDLAGAPFSVLVIPDTEKASPESEGFGLALHGFKHKAEFSQGRSYMGIIGMNLTHGEAEFAGLSEYESSRLLHSGIAAWKSLFEGRPSKPAAFVPPTWYSNKFLPSQVHAEKMLYEDRFSLVTARGRRYISLVASFAGILDFMVKPAFKFGELILKLPVGLPRIALHPVDFPERGAAVHDLIRTALHSGRRLALYSEL